MKELALDDLQVSAFLHAKGFQLIRTERYAPSRGSHSDRKGLRTMPRNLRAPNPCLSAALDYCERGWSVIPLEPRGKRPIVKWERYQSERPTRADARQWWRKEPNANVGIVTGRINKLVVLDVDPAKGGNQTLTDLEQEHGGLPETVSVRTGGGGQHFYFQHPGVPIPNCAGKLGPGLDVRGEGGY